MLLPWTPATTLAPREAEAAGPGPIRKPLPPQHFVDHGTNAEMRWDVPHGPGDTPASRLFVRNHTETPLLDAATYTLLVHGDGLRRAAVITLDDLRALAGDAHDLRPRVHRQRAQLLRHPAGPRGAGHPVAPRAASAR